MTRTQYLEQIELLRQTMITVELETKRRYPIGQRCKWVRDGSPDKHGEVFAHTPNEYEIVWVEFAGSGWTTDVHVRDLIPIDEQGNEIP